MAAPPAKGQRATPPRACPKDAGGGTGAASQPVPQSGAGKTSGGGDDGKSERTMSTNSKRETWRFILQMLLSVVSAVCTTLGITSCQ